MPAKRRRESSATRAELRILILLQNKQTPLSASDSGLAYLFVGHVPVGGIIAVGDRSITLRSHCGGQKPAIVVYIVADTRHSPALARRRRTLGRLNKRCELVQQVRCLTDGSSSVALTAKPCAASNPNHPQLLLPITSRQLSRPRGRAYTTPPNGTEPVQARRKSQNIIFISFFGGAQVCRCLQSLSLFRH